MPDQKYITIAEVTERLNLTTRAVNNLIRSGELQGFQFGAEIRIRSDLLEEFVSQSQIKGRGMSIQEIEKRANEILKRAEREQRDLTPSEDFEFRNLEASLKKLSRRERLNGFETRAELDDIKHGRSFISNDSGGFANFGEFLFSVVNNPRDSRLSRLQGEKRSQKMGVGSLGGFAVPDQFRLEIFALGLSEGIVRPRATVFEAGYPSDGRLDLPSLDRSKGAYGGIVITHGKEALDFQEISALLRLTSFQPQQMSAFAIVTNDLLANWGAGSDYMINLLRLSISGTEDDDFIKGNGVNRSLGIINSPGAIIVNRATVNQIGYTDVTGLFKRVRLGSGNLVWLANQLSIDQLAPLADNPANMSAILQSSVAPMSILGVPVLWSEEIPTLGNRGDLVLANMLYFGIKDGSLRIDLSKGRLFSEDRSCFRLIWHVDAHSLVDKPMVMNGNPSETISPFVILGDPQG